MCSQCMMIVDVMEVEGERRGTQRLFVVEHVILGFATQVSGWLPLGYFGHKRFCRT